MWITGVITRPIRECRRAGNLSPVLSNIYLNELDQIMVSMKAMFDSGKYRRLNSEYERVQSRKRHIEKEGGKDR